ncbi:hypothetical protein JW916_11515 [Candidatus Sumerlaeota bacterium]|nr:hypothetical protein [Candidatus Sumerlaeota bacterium]
MSEHSNLLIVGVCIVAFIGGYGLVSMIVDFIRKRLGSSDRPRIDRPGSPPAPPPPTDPSRSPWAPPPSQNRPRDSDSR